MSLVAMLNVILVLCFLRVYAEVNESVSHHVLAKRILEIQSILDSRPHQNDSKSAQQQPSLSSHSQLYRYLSSSSSISDNKSRPKKTQNREAVTECDAAFLHCLVDEYCTDCFTQLGRDNIDWASVTINIQCDSALQYLYDSGHCTSFRSNSEGRELFCDTFNACVENQQGGQNNDDNDESNKSRNKIDCSTLTECKWDGMHQSFIGDGVCNHNMDGCYNTEICNYDGGDCCQDTCTSKSSYMECGHDGYACINPESVNCNPDLNPECPEHRKNDPDELQCANNMAKFRLIMYDSFGDGWDETRIKIEDPNGITIFEGGLDEGFEGTQYICLKTIPQCYRVSTWGGIWGREVSWAIKPMNEGAPAIGGGGAPMNCEFNTVGINCMPICFGRPNKHPENDPDYRDYKQLYNCMSAKCPIQLGACKADDTCSSCITEDPSEFCYGLDMFTAVTDCALCKCSDITDEQYCMTKTTPGVIIPTDNKRNGEGREKTPCSPTETLKGGQSIIHFSKCTQLDKVGMMITDFDENNFGDLDKFEACAHSFSNSPQSGHTAMGCLQILVNAISADKDSYDGNVPVEAMSQLANSIYTDAEGFCDCAKASSDSCPLCPSFSNFKTLLFESLDACKALDEIDCDAWNEFQRPCRTNLATTFDVVDFTNAEQCDYVLKSCGGVGPFPAFRRLDCIDELPETSWNFYNEFASLCLTKPTPAPTPKIAPLPVKPSDENKKPYIPPEQRGKGRSSGAIMQSQWFRSLVLLCVLGGGFYALFTKYRARINSGSFISYRRANPYNISSSDEDAYNGLTLESTSFEAPAFSTAEATT